MRPPPTPSTAPHDAAPAERPAPRLSIGLPVYNGARYLAECLDMLLGQTFADFELVINDNASTDETETICRDYADRDRRIRYHRSERNLGACGNFNRVFELSRGEYFHWQAYDDLCAADFMERCVAALDRDPGLVLCHARTVKIDAEGNRLTVLPDPTDGGPAFARRVAAGGRRPDGSSRSPSRRFLDVLLSSGWSARSYGVIRSTALRKTSLILPYYGAEKVLMAELALQGRFHDLPEPLFFQRVHEAASSSMQTGTEQAAFVLGENSTRNRSPRLRLLQGYLRAATAYPLPPAQRAACLMAIGRYLLQFSKWRGIASGLLFGRGVRRDRH